MDYYKFYTVDVTESEKVITFLFENTVVGISLVTENGETAVAFAKWKCDRYGENDSIVWNYDEMVKWQNPIKLLNAIIWILKDQKVGKIIFQARGKRAKVWERLCKKHNTSYRIIK
jgi:hypothetical protein